MVKKDVADLGEISEKKNKHLTEMVEELGF